MYSKQQIRRLKLMSEGKCPICAKKRNFKKEQKTKKSRYTKYARFCPKCLRKQRVYRRNKVRLYKQMHLCILCKRKHSKKSEYCSNCSSLIYGKNSKPERFLKRKQIKLKYIANGNCETCNSPRSIRSKRLCDKHLNKKNKSRKIRTEFRRNNALCINCREPIDVEHSSIFCRFHRLKNNEYVRNRKRIKNGKTQSILS